MLSLHLSDLNFVLFLDVIKVTTFNLLNGWENREKVQYNCVQGLFQHYRLPYRGYMCSAAEFEGKIQGKKSGS